MKSPADLAVRLAWAVARDPEGADSDSLGTAARLLAATSQGTEYRPTDAMRRHALRAALACVAVAAGVGTVASVRHALNALEAANKPRLSVVH
jgi:hypothetical protein